MGVNIIECVRWFLGCIKKLGEYREGIQDLKMQMMRKKYWGELLGR